MADAVISLAVERSRVDGYELLAVEGELDIATAPRMIAALNEAFAELAPPLVVDLSSVDFMDSTGLALLMNAHRRVRRRGQGFAIVCPAARSPACSRSRTWSRASTCSPTGPARSAPPPSPHGLDPNRVAADTCGVWKLRLPPPARFPFPA